MADKVDEEQLNPEMDEEDLGGLVEPKEAPIQPSMTDIKSQVPKGGNFNLDQIRKPLKLFQKRDKPSQSESTPKTESSAAANLPGLSRAARFTAGAVNAFRQGFGASRTPKPSESDKKKDQLKSAAKSTAKAGMAVGQIAASGGTNVLAWGKMIFEGSKALVNYVKAGWKEALAALAVTGGIAIMFLGLLGFGTSSKLPGNNTGTSFAQATTEYSVLNKLRLVAEGDKDRAVATELKTNGVDGMVRDIQELFQSIEESNFFQGDEFTQFEAHINGLLTILSEASATPLDDQSVSALVEKMQQVSESVIEIYDSVLAKTLGAPDPKSGFYRLPDLPIYHRKSPDREFGTEQLIYVIIKSAKEFQAKYPKYLIRITDMSLPQGGLMETSPGKFHKSHQCGVDADITLAHVDNPVPSDGALIVGNKAFKPQVAKDLGDIFFANGVKVIYYNYPNNDYPKFTHEDGHDNHMHIRIVNQKESYPGCLSQ